VPYQIKYAIVSMSQSTRFSLAVDIKPNGVQSFSSPHRTLLLKRMMLKLDAGTSHGHLLRTITCSTGHLRRNVGPRLGVPNSRVKVPAKAGVRAAVHWGCAGHHEARMQSSQLAASARDGNMGKKVKERKKVKVKESAIYTWRLLSRSCGK
jgi:hypothetical protein